MTVATRRIWEVLSANESFFNKSEEAYAKRLVCWTKNASAPFQHLKYLKYVQSLHLVKQKQEVNFLIQIFRQADIHLSFFEKRHFQNDRGSQTIRRSPKRAKTCLASDSDIQALIRLF